MVRPAEVGPGLKPHDVAMGQQQLLGENILYRLLVYSFHSKLVFENSVNFNLYRCTHLIAQTSTARRIDPLNVNKIRWALLIILKSFTLVCRTRTKANILVREDRPTEESRGTHKFLTILFNG